MIVLNLTAEVEAAPGGWDEGLADDVVFRLHGHEIWRTPAQWQRYDETGVKDAVELFAERLKERLS